MTSLESTAPGVDRVWTFDELVAEGMTLVRAYAPEWTDHNLSDPGITLVEMLAYVTEILIYRARRVSPDARLAFLKLMRPATRSADWIDGPLDALDQEILDGVEDLSRTHYAATTADFERHARACVRTLLGPDARVRIVCLAGLELRHTAAGIVSRSAEADCSVVLVPEPALPEQDLERLLEKTREDLASRCLLTSRVHVTGPAILRLQVACRILPRPGVPAEEVATRIGDRLRERFGAGSAGGDLAPRPFGRPLHLSEIVVALDATPGVDRVDGLELLHAEEGEAAPPDPVRSRIGIRIGIVATLGHDTRLGGEISVPMVRFEQDATGEIEVVRLRPWELVHVALAVHGSAAKRVLP